MRLHRQSLLITCLAPLGGAAALWALDSVFANPRLSALGGLLTTLVIGTGGLLINHLRGGRREFAEFDGVLERFLALSPEARDAAADSGQILDRKQLETALFNLQALQESNAKSLIEAKVSSANLRSLRDVLDALPTGLIVFDDRGRVLHSNRALSPMIGRHASELIGAELDDWCDIPELREILEQRIHQRSRNADEIHFEQPGRANRWVEVKFRDVVTTPGRERHTLASFVDATEPVRARMARTEFVVGLSHELKTPLHTINLYAEALRGEDGGDEEIRLEAANVIGDEIERIDSLVRGMLDSTRIESGAMDMERTQVRLPDLLVDCLERIRPNAEEREIELVSELPPHSEPVYIDKSMFAVAMNNLLSNAVKYNNPGGTLILRMRDNTDAIEIEVSDTGKGIPADDLPHVFEKFYRAGNVDGDGHGVGLSLAQEIVQKHQGSLIAQSDEDVGTTFTLRLPKNASLTREGA